MLTFKVGEKVVFHGLTEKADFNQKEGTFVQYPHFQNYKVKLTDSSSIVVKVRMSLRFFTKMFTQANNLRALDGSSLRAFNVGEIVQIHGLGAENVKDQKGTILEVLGSPGYVVEVSIERKTSNWGFKVNISVSFFTTNCSLRPGI